MRCSRGQLSQKNNLLEKLSLTIQKSLSVQEEMLQKMGEQKDGNRLIPHMKIIQNQIAELYQVFGIFKETVIQEWIPFHQDSMSIVARVTHLYDEKIIELTNQLEDQKSKRIQCEEDLKILKGLVSITLEKQNQNTSKNLCQQEQNIQHKININDYINANESLFKQQTQQSFAILEDNSKEKLKFSTVRKGSQKDSLNSDNSELLNISQPLFSKQLTSQSKTTTILDIRHKNISKNHGTENMRTLNYSSSLRKDTKMKEQSFLRSRRSSKGKNDWEGSRLQQLRTNLLCRYPSRMI